MEKYKKEVSIIVPVYNEQETIKELITRLALSLSASKIRYEVIVVDDNSKDNTAKIVKALAKQLPVRYLLKKGKKGKAFSLFEGFSESKYTNVAFIDADLQYLPEEIASMILKLEDSDIVVANRKKYEESLLRKFLSRSFRFGFGKTLFGLDHDIQAGLKVFKKEVLESIYFKPNSQWTFDLEFLYKAREAGFTITNHNIAFLKRKNGESKIGVVKTSYEIGTSAVGLRLLQLKPRRIKPEIDGTMRGAGMR